MPLTPTNMRVVDVARLLNSTSQGFVLAQARLYRQFNRVGFRIAATENTRNINLIKYIAWLCDERHTPAEEFVYAGVMKNIKPSGNGTPHSLRLDEISPLCRR